MTIPTDIVFGNSYVLQLDIAPYAIVFRIDFALSPSHLDYQAPPPGEATCFRRGTLTIRGFRHLDWDASNAPPARDASGEVDWGCLDVFKRTVEGWYLEGDWGRMVLVGGDLAIDISKGADGL